MFHSVEGDNKAGHYCIISWQCEGLENAVFDAVQYPGMTDRRDEFIASSQCAPIMGCFTALKVTIRLDTIASYHGSVKG
jgi:hypothetical protein